MQYLASVWRRHCLLVCTAIFFLTFAPVATAQDLLRKPGGPQFYSIKPHVSARPVLTWPKIPEAVYYEVELLSAPPENPNGFLPSQYRTRVSEKIFTPGYNPDLEDYPDSRLFWRVLPYDIRGNPVTGYSDAREVIIDPSLKEALKPLITSRPNNGRPAPLYPVYTWIPIIGASQYEVEILKEKPENPNGVEPSRYQTHRAIVSGFSYYDPTPRLTPGTYYWRVRGLDGIGCPVGVFSDAQPVTVDLSAGNYAATFGDSLTHGGGNLSHSAADEEYCYQTYLNFPAVNLGRSGDTTADLLLRFVRDVTPFHPRYLLILGGINNIREGASAESVINDLTAIRNLCLAYNIRPIFLTIPPIHPANIQSTIHAASSAGWKASLKQVNDFIRSQPYFIDIAPVLTDSKGELAANLSMDGLHPGVAGKQKMAAVINSQWSRVTISQKD